MHLPRRLRIGRRGREGHDQARETTERAIRELLTRVLTSRRRTARGSRRSVRRVRTCVMTGGIGVDPIGLRVDVQIDTLARSGRLSSSCCRGRSVPTRAGLGLIQMEQLAGPLEIHAGIREKHFVGQLSTTVRRRSAIGKVVAALRGQDQRGVLLPPGLERLA